MAIKKKHNIKTPACMQETINGSFIPNGNGAISTKYGLGFSVARSDTGKYVVTLDEPFANFVCIHLQHQFASSNADHHELLVGDISIANKTFEIIHLASADVSATDIAAADISTSGTANKINFSVTVARSDVPGAGV